MPLLLCPNDNTTMQSVQRSGVEFDICPTCRGVWLDRGELEKLLDTASREASAQESGDAYHRPQQHYGRPPERRDWDDDDDHHYRRRRRPSIFDIFD